MWRQSLSAPLVRRAFSIAGLRRSDVGVEIDVIYRVVGTATRWMQSLREGDALSLLGPLGNEFSMDDSRNTAWLVAGGVGLPPMLFLAEALRNAGKNVIAFCGAQTRELLALSLNPDSPPSPNAHAASFSVREFASSGVPVILSTDDGTLGYAGRIGDAMVAFHQANPIDEGGLIVYACGPEPMMRFVAEHCIARGISCEVCMERAMACGLGTCQSCVVPVRDTNRDDGWRYRLCCTDGPVFHSAEILWHVPPSSTQGGGSGGGRQQPAHLGS